MSAAVPPPPFDPEVRDLAGLLRAAGLDPSAEELADALWLAARTRRPARTDPDPDAPAPGEHPEAPSESGVRDGAAGDAPAAPELPGPVPPEPEVEDPVRLYADGPGASGDVTSDAEVPVGDAVPVRVPGAAALPRILDIQRALRALQRHRPPGPPTRTVLDEDATAQASARALGLVIPVFRPESRREATVRLVMDASPSMAVWQEMFEELRAVCERLGAFRDVQVHRLHRLADGTPAVGRGPAPGVGLRSGEQLRDPTGRALTMVVSDCAGPLWREGAAQRLLYRWAQCTPCVVVQPLPQRLWSRSWLPTERGVLERTEDGTGGPGGGRLRFRRDRAPRPGRPSGGLTVPVLPPNATALGAWARLVAGLGTGPVPAEVGRVLARHPAAPVPLPRAARPPRELVGRFRASAAPGAVRLAVYLSAAPLTLPVMRLVQRTMLPDSEPSDLAEVLLSGLLRRTGDVPGQWYEFVPGVQDVLLGPLGRDEAALVLKHCSEYVLAHFGRDVRNFPALAVSQLTGVASAPSDPGPARAPGGQLPQAFAHVSAKVVRRYLPGPPEPPEDEPPAGGSAPVAPAPAGRARAVRAARDRLADGDARAPYEAVALLRRAVALPAGPQDPPEEAEAALTAALLVLWAAQRDPELLDEAQRAATGLHTPTARSLLGRVLYERALAGGGDAELLAAADREFAAAGATTTDPVLRRDCAVRRSRALIRLAGLSDDPAPLREARAVLEALTSPGVGGGGAGGADGAGGAGGARGAGRGERAGGAGGAGSGGAGEGSGTGRGRGTGGAGRAGGAAEGGAVSGPGEGRTASRGGGADEAGEPAATGRTGTDAGQGGTGRTGGRGGPAEGRGAGGAEGAGTGGATGGSGGTDGGGATGEGARTRGAGGADGTGADGATGAGGGTGTAGTAGGSGATGAEGDAGRAGGHDADGGAGGEVGAAGGADGAEVGDTDPGLRLALGRVLLALLPRTPDPAARTALAEEATVVLTAVLAALPGAAPGSDPGAADPDVAPAGTGAPDGVGPPARVRVELATALRYLPGRLEEAARQLVRALDEAVGDTELRLAGVLCLARVHRARYARDADPAALEEAADAYGRARRLSPRDGEAFAELLPEWGDVLLERARTADGQRFVSAAVRVLRESRAAVPQSDPGAAYRLLRLAAGLRLRHAYEGDLVDLREAEHLLELAARHGHGPLERARAWREHGDVQQEIHAHTRTVDRLDRAVDSYRRAWRAALEADREDRTQTALQLAARVLELRGEVLERLARPRAALDAYRAALELWQRVDAPHPAAPPAPGSDATEHGDVPAPAPGGPNSPEGKGPYEAPREGGAPDRFAGQEPGPVGPNPPEPGSPYGAPRRAGHGDEPAPGRDAEARTGRGAEPGSPPNSGRNAGPDAGRDTGGAVRPGTGPGAGGGEDRGAAPGVEPTSGRTDGPNDARGAAPDAERDAGRDTGHGAVPDSGRDAGHAGEPDSGRESVRGAGRDAGHGAVPDFDPGTRPATGRDSRHDAASGSGGLGPGAGRNAGPDSGRTGGAAHDSGPGGAPDAGHGAVPDSVPGAEAGARVAGGHDGSRSDAPAARQDPRHDGPHAHPHEGPAEGPGGGAGGGRDADRPGDRRRALRARIRRLEAGL
ncbi:SAV_2336 N-terminal domain-related protein [Streptomyces sp. NPDC001568]|uniref:SAV_2336 N-terminal domain-related protein n=1 Tax=Streptomyces sp. NPDC001568 TaxID=3364588 RepID=UPI0036A367D9